MKIVKKNVLEVIKNLPDDSSYEDIMEKIYFMQKGEAGLKDVEDSISLK